MGRACIKDMHRRQGWTAAEDMEETRRRDLAR
jgi:hypothetical protein